MDLVRNIENKFLELFNQRPLLVRSPGRVNLIGEHTDYNMGYVLPAAIDKAIYFAITKRGDNNCKLFASDLNESFEFSIGSLNKTPKGWPNYLMGVVDQFVKNGFNISGFNCVFGGDIPIGAGLSSSAAVEAGLAFSLNHINNLNIDSLSLVKMAQKAENEFVGVNCGIMDQYINIFGKKGNVLRIDCRTLQSSLFPFDFPDVSIVLFNTNVAHSLAASQYNLRRMECAKGVKLINEKYPSVQSLRDVTIEMLVNSQIALEPVIYKRCKYVVEENYRMENACSSLTNKDLHSFGKLMYQTHYGLSRDYEVSCKELDYLVEAVKDNSEVYGARMMGGGFGGCTINLIKNNFVEPICKEVLQKYKAHFKIDADYYITSLSGGTGIISE